MQHMKASLAVAVAAIVAGWFCSAAGAAKNAAIGCYGVGLAAAAVAAFRTWRLVLKILTNLETCAEKLTYMEHRMDKAEAHISDVCRHLSQMFAEFRLEKNAGHGDTKWWWCSRRVRDLYEAFGAALMQKGALMEHVESIWKLLQLEVYLRACRDLVQERLNKLESPADYDPDAEVSYHAALKNMNAGLGKVDLWEPMQMEEVQALEAKSPWEKVLKLQVLERNAELEYYKTRGNADLFEGTNFQTAGSSGN